MSILTKARSHQMDAGLTILRVAIGAIFVAHGGQKLFVYGFAGVSGAFAQMGVPMPELMGPFVAMLEFLGGFALIAGLMTRLASTGLASTMLVAIVLVHLKSGFFAPNGIEFPLSLLASTMMLAITGAGRWSADALIGGRSAQAEIGTVSPRMRRAA